MREQTQKEDDICETIERMLVEAFHDCLPIGETAPFYAALTRALALHQAQVSTLRAEQTRLREALDVAWLDIKEWIQLAKALREDVTDPDFSPLTPTKAGIAKSERVLEQIGTALSPMSRQEEP